MARENQGLHIALIIFVTLTLVLGVTTFIFFRKLEESTIKAKAEADRASTEKNNADKVQKDNLELKRMMGVEATANLDTINEDFNKQMTTYAGNFEEASRVYKKVVEYLDGVVRKKDATIADLEVKLQDEKNRNEIREQIKDPQIAEHKKAAEAAEADRASEREKFNQDRQTITQEKSALAAKLDKAQKDAVAVVDKIKADLEETQKRTQKVQQALQDRSEQLNKVVNQSFETADGKIRWVNQRNGTVWVNIGQADGLPRQTTFAVYPAAATNVENASKKASIEVTQILGEHLAEARILEDNVGDPILPGDLIHTPIWTPGEHQRFALSDGMDVDGDGKSDTEIVRNLITMAGGVIVAELDDKGNRKGKMDTNTRYLVLGKQHDENTSKATIEARTKMIREADMLGVQKAPLAELLKKMGWKNQTPVVHYGPGANPADFRPQAPEGVNPVSRGTVSPLFQPRTPPRKGSAY
jgi:hypothetical protein